MKNLYILFVGVSFLFAANGFAQGKKIAKGTEMNTIITQVAAKNQPAVQPMNTNDTITAHWDVIYPVPVDTPVTYSCSALNPSHSYVAGQNQYGDLAKAQLFDATYGVTTTNGTITNLLLWVGGKLQNAGTGSWVPTIWADNAGTPGTVLGTATPVTVALMDTSVAAKKRIGPLTALKGIFNVNAAFSPAIAIPVSQKFWAGFTITYAAGDSAGLITSRDGRYTTTGNGNFVDAITHTTSQWSDNSWNNFVTDWGLEVALGVYPVLSVATDVHENNNFIAALQNMPNPATNNTTITYSIRESANVVLSVFDVTGKQVISLVQGMQTAGNHNLKLDVSNLNSGLYFYTISAGDYKMTSKMSVVK